MNSRMPCFRVFAVSLAAVLFASLAGAADKPGDPKRLQQQLRAAEREKSQLTQKKNELEGQVKAAQDALTEAKGKEDAAARRGAALSRKLEAANGEKEALQAKLAETEKALESERQLRADTEGRLAAAQREAAQQSRAFTEEKRQLQAELSASRERNERMYKLGFELIDRYEREAGAHTEPFTGLRRAQIEKMAEADREKFDKDRLPPVVPEINTRINVLPAPSPENGDIAIDAIYAK